MNAELDEHLDGERVEGGANRRNDHSKKSVLTGTSKMTLSNPRDRAGKFDPKGAAHWLKIKNPPCRSGNQRRKLWLRCMSRHWPCVTSIAGPYGETQLYER